MTVDRSHRLTAWNGISITTPDTWEAAVTGSNHLHFESQLTPVFEIRWEKIPQKSSSNSISRSIQQIENLSGKKLRSFPIPSFLDKLLPGYNKFSYTWHDRQTISVLLLYCRSCSTFVLLQFFHDGDNTNHPIHNIESFSCHNNDESAQLWSIQDFRVNIPPSFTLSGYNMAAGFTKLSFLKNKSSLHVCRIAPAAIRLQKQNLEEIFSILADLTQDEPVHRVSETFIQYERTPTIGVQVIMRLRRKKPFCVGTLLHDDKNDRLLCVILEGIHPPDKQTFKTIQSSYEIISQKKYS